MNLLVVSEGRHELQSGQGQGAIEILLHRLLGDFTCDKRKVSDPALPRVHATGRGYFKRALEWMRFAENRGYDALILVVDQDDYPRRRAELDAAQQFRKFEVERALGIAIQSFDAWMLADETALSSVLGRTIKKQPAPEEIDDPKAICKGLCGNAMAQSEMYEKLAAKMKLRVVEDRCPNGFAPFANRVRKLRAVS